MRLKLQNKKDMYCKLFLIINFVKCNILTAISNKIAKILLYTQQYIHLLTYISLTSWICTIFINLSICSFEAFVSISVLNPSLNLVGSSLQLNFEICNILLVFLLDNNVLLSNTLTAL